MKRILIILDQSAESKPIQQTLAAHDLIWTRTAHEALRIANDDRFDLVLIDLNISDMSPWGALDLFNVLHPMLPVLMLADQPAEIARALACGADACILRPVDKSVLHHLADRLLTETHQERMDRLMHPLYRRLSSPSDHLSQPSQPTQPTTTRPAHENKNSPRR